MSSSPSDKQLRRVIIAASIGNAIEWFDLVVYGYFATIISKLFFPSADETTALLLTFGTFGASYLMRPLGALVLGSYADRAGRKASLMVSILLMLVGTLMIALMPTYATIGIWAPIGILLSRLMQGFSVGGEFGSSTALLVEHSPKRRGFMSSWQYASQGLSTVLAAGSGALLTGLLTTPQMESWGWRLPFFFGLLIGPVGFYIRRHVEDGKEYTDAKKDASATNAVSVSPLKILLTTQKMRIALSVGILVMSTAVNYLLLYMPTYAIKQLKMPPTIGFISTMTAAILLTLLPPFVGILSDRVGRTRIMLVSATLMLLALYPFFVLINQAPSFATMIALLLVIGLFKSIYVGGLPALMAELFPIETRASGLSLSYNIGVSIFGGFTPAIFTWLIQTTGSNVSPSFYLIFCAVLSLISLITIRRTTNLR